MILRLARFSVWKSYEEWAEKVKLLEHVISEVKNQRSMADKVAICNQYKGTWSDKDKVLYN